MGEDAKKGQSGMGVCRFCGQSLLIEDGGSMTRPQLEEAATMRCACDSAKEYQTIANRGMIAKQRIDELFGENAGEYEQSEETRDYVKTAVDLVCNKKVKQVVVTFKTGLNARVMRMAKDKIKVVREVSETDAFEQ